MPALPFNLMCLLLVGGLVVFGLLVLVVGFWAHDRDADAHRGGRIDVQGRRP